MVDPSIHVAEAIGRRNHCILGNLENISEMYGNVGKVMKMPVPGFDDFGLVVY